MSVDEQAVRIDSGAMLEGPTKIWDVNADTAEDEDGEEAVGVILIQRWILPSSWGEIRVLEWGIRDEAINIYEKVKEPRSTLT